MPEGTAHRIIHSSFPAPNHTHLVHCLVTQDGDREHPLLHAIERERLDPVWCTILLDVR